MSGTTPATLPGVRLEIVRTGERLAEIGQAWSALWRDADASMFQSHAWVMAWWNNLPDRDRHELLIIVAWRNETLEAVLPLAISRRRSIRLLEWAVKDYTDYCDAILRPGIDPTLLKQMWEHLSTEAGFDVVYLNRLLPKAVARTLLDNVQRGVVLMPNRRSEQSLRVIGAWTSGEAWFEAQSKKARQNYRRGVKSIGEGADLQFRLLPPEESMAPVLQRLGALKRQWLERNGIEAPLFDDGSPTLTALVQALADSGQLRAFVLERDGAIVAISINFVQGQSMMAFLTTYDPEFERGSPGMVLMVDYIKWSIDHGLTTVDFLCGAEEFKRRFATETVTLEAFAGARTLPGRAAMLADRMRHWVKGKTEKPQQAPDAA